MIPIVIQSMVSGVLEVIKRGSRSGNLTDEPELNTFTQSCRSLNRNFSISQDLCPFAESLNYILACYYDEYLKLLSNPFIAAVVRDRRFCHRLANGVCASPKTQDSIVYDSVCNNSYLCIMLSPKHLLAMCHMRNPDLLQEALQCEATHPEAIKPLAQNESFRTQKFGEAEDVLDRQGPEKTHDRLQESEVELAPSGAPQGPSDPPVAPAEDEGQPDVAPRVEARPPEGREALGQEANATQNPPSAPDKGSLQAEKKERKGDKENGEKAPASEDPPSGAQPQGALPSTAVPPSASAEGRGASHTNKETVVVRLSNKIKVGASGSSLDSGSLFYFCGDS